MMKEILKRPLMTSLASSCLLVLCCCLPAGAWLLLPGTAGNSDPSHQPWVQSLAWSPDSSQLAVGSGNTSVTIWQIRPARLLITFTKHRYRVVSLAWSPRGTLLASADQEFVTYLWDPRTGQSIKQLESEYVAWSSDGARLAYTGAANINLWDAGSRQETILVPATGGFELVYPSNTHVAWSPDNTRLATSSTDGTLTIWNVETGKPIRVISAHKGFAEVVDWAPKGDLLASGGDDRKLDVWDTATGRLLHQAEGPIRVLGVAWSPKVPGELAWNSDSGQVTITDFGKLNMHLDAGNDGQIWVVAWSPDGKLLAAGTDENTVVVWDAASGRRVQLLTLPAP